MSTEVSVHMPSDPARLYAMVSDVTRMGEWSPECYRCEWIDGSAGPAPGARFKGYNRVGPFKWATECIVEAAEPGREFRFVAGDEKEGKTRWTYRFRSNGSGTVVAESYETIIPAPIWIRIVERVVAFGRTRDAVLKKGMQQTLNRIKAAAES